MKQVQRGFTLIELVMVIVILGVLAAVALPKFVDLKSEAETAGLAGIVGGIASASSVNYAARSVTTSHGTLTAGLSCADAAARILANGAPSGYTVDAGTSLSGTTGVSNNCKVTQDSSGKTATAVIISITP